MLQLPFSMQSTLADNGVYLYSFLPHYIRSFVLLVTMATLKAFGICPLMCATPTCDATG